MRARVQLIGGGVGGYRLPEPPRFLPLQAPADSATTAFAGDTNRGGGGEHDYGQERAEAPDAHYYDATIPNF